MKYSGYLEKRQTNIQIIKKSQINIQRIDKLLINMTCAYYKHKIIQLVKDYYNHTK